MINRTGTNNDLQNTKHYTENQILSNTNPIKTRDELGNSERISSFCSTNETRRITLVTNTVICHESCEDVIVVTTNGTYLWSFVTQISRNGYPSHCCDRKTFEVMISL